jgi:hypothetical protein
MISAKVSANIAEDASLFTIVNPTMSLVTMVAFACCPSASGVSVGAMLVAVHEDKL